MYCSLSHSLQAVIPTSPIQESVGLQAELDCRNDYD